MALQIYLDTSAYNRPFDDQSQPRIWLESLAVSLILQMLEDGSIELIASSVVMFETARNPYELQRKWVQKVMKLAVAVHAVDESIRQRAKILKDANIKALDALHIAVAEAADVDYFVTCDDRLIRRYRRLASQPVKVCDPTEFVRVVSLGEDI